MKRWTILLVFSAALCLGQGVDDFAWWDSPIVQNLNLTPDQHNQIRATVREYRDRMIEQRAAVQKAEANLMDFMNEDQVNEAKATDAVNKLVVARGDMMRSVSQMSLKLRMVLTPQQWQQLQRRRAQQRQPGQPQPPVAARQPLRQRGPAPQLQRQQMQQGLKQMRQRLQQGRPLTPEERQQLLQRLKEMEQLLMQQGEPGPPGPPPQP
jgi:Spy/CpxP family protein refolding chaperone